MSFQKEPCSVSVLEYGHAGRSFRRLLQAHKGLLVGCTTPAMALQQSLLFFVKSCNGPLSTRKTSSLRPSSAEKSASAGSIQNFREELGVAVRTYLLRKASIRLSANFRLIFRHGHFLTTHRIGGIMGTHQTLGQNAQLRSKTASSSTTLKVEVFLEGGKTALLRSKTVSSSTILKVEVFLEGEKTAQLRSKTASSSTTLKVEVFLEGEKTTQLRSKTASSEHNSVLVVTTRSLRGYYAVTTRSLRSLRGHCSHYAVATVTARSLRSLCGHCGHYAVATVTTRSLRGHCAVTTRSLRGYYAVTTQSQYAVTTRSLRGYYAVTTQSPRGYYAVTIRLPCSYYSNYAVILRTTRFKSGLRLRNAQLRSKSGLKASFTL